MFEYNISKGLSPGRESNTSVKIAKGAIGLFFKTNRFYIINKAKKISFEQDIHSITTEELSG